MNENEKKLCRHVNYFLGDKVICELEANHLGMHECGGKGRTTWTGRNYYMSEGERAIFAAVYAAKYMDALALDEMKPSMAAFAAADLAANSIEYGRNLTRSLDETEDDEKIAMLKDMFG